MSLERTRISPSVDSTASLILQTCIKCCTCFITRRSVSWKIQLSSVPNWFCEPVALHSFCIILEVHQHGYSEPPLVSLQQKQHNYISVHIIVGLIDLLSVELSLLFFFLCQLPALCSYQNEIWSVHLHGGTRWRSWLRHCATSWKVAGSIPDGVIGIFSLT